MSEPIALSWSGGKDSALALDALRSDPRFEVAALFTTIAEQGRRVSHHGVREELLDAQGRACGLDVFKVVLPAPATGTCPSEEYDACFGAALARLRDQGIHVVAHGDLFLEDLRQWRERQVGRMGMRAVFPLWGRNTRGLVQSFIARGFRAKLCCVAACLGRRFLGREIDASLLRELPAGVDPAGENGEYHSFVYAGPVFSAPIAIREGVSVEREGRWFVDLEGVAGP
jgi:uncharacterized protein (TIGR00290 family)